MDSTASVLIGFTEAFAGLACGVFPGIAFTFSDGLAATRAPLFEKPLFLFTKELLGLEAA